MKRKLSKKEERIITLVVTHPDRTDREISDLTGINRNTCAFLRNRLVREGVLTPYYIPDPRRINAELLVVIYTEFNPAISDTERIAKTGPEVDAYEEIFYSMGEGRHGFSLSLAANYTDIARINDKRIATYAVNDFLDSKHPDMVILPLQRSVVHNFFDHAPLLQTCFGSVEDPGPEVPIEPHVVKPTLSRNEKEVLVRLMDHHLPHDEELARDIGVSRKTIHNIKKRLLRIGIIRKAYIPDLSKLGFTILHLCHVKLDPRYRFKLSDLERLSPPNAIFSVIGQYEILSLSPFRDFADYVTFYNDYSRKLRGDGIVMEDPINRIFTLDSAKIIKFLEFRPLLEKMFGPQM